MHFDANMRGQTVRICYGTNPQGQVAGVWLKLADGTRAKDMTDDEEEEAFALARQHQASLGAHADITPPACWSFARQSELDRCKAVVLLHAEAAPSQLLGFALGRARELAMLARIAGSSDEDEGALREVCEHLWNGLETVTTTLDVMSTRMKD